VISSLVTVRLVKRAANYFAKDRLWFLGRRSRRPGRRPRLSVGRHRRPNFCGRFVEPLGQLVEDRVTGQTQLAQHFPRRAHHFGHSLWPDHYQSDCKNQYYFKRVQASMTIRSARRSTNKRTSVRSGKFRATSPSQSIICVRSVNIREWTVNDA
jgi:hypothetical protein